MKISIFLKLIVCLVAWSFSVRAGVIVEFVDGTVSGNNSRNPVNVDTGLINTPAQATAVGLPTSTPTVNVDAGDGATNWYNLQAGAIADVAGSSLTETSADRFEFEIQAATNDLQISSLNLDFYQLANIGGSGTYTLSYAVFTDVNNSGTFTNHGFTDLDINYSGGGAQYQLHRGELVSFSGITLNTGDTLDVVISFGDNRTNGGPFQAGIQDIQVDGVVIPEPSTMALVAVSLGAIALFRRRR